MEITRIQLEGILGGIKHAMEDRDSEEEEDKSPLTDLMVESYSARLKEHLSVYHEPHDFKVGDIVRLKTLFTDKYSFPPNYPVIVERLSDKPLYQVPESSGAPSFYEPNDIRCGFIHQKTGYFIFLWFDKNMLEPVPNDDPF